MVTASSATKNKANPDGPPVRAYFAALPADSRRGLKKLRDIIRAAAPSATETISYGIPAFRLEGRVLVWYAAWENHYSLYPMTAAITRAYTSELEKFDKSKGTIRFSMTKPLPAGLITRLVKARVAELRRADKK